MRPLVSCIITTHKRPVEILKRSILSVINQTYNNLEIIIVNDYPEDYDLQISISKMINSFKDKRISYIVHEKNSGAPKARNTGINHSKGEYVAFLDDDDEWLPDKIDKQLKLFDDDQVGLVYCEHYRVEKNRTIRIVPHDYCKDARNKIFIYNFIGGTSFPLMRKKAIIEAGMFDINCKSSQDTDMWIRIIEKYKIKYCKEPLVKYHVSEEAISTDITKIKDGYLYQLEKYRDIYDSDKQLYIKKLNMIAVALFVHGSRKEGMKYWKKAIFMKVTSINNLLFIKKLGGYSLLVIKRNLSKVKVF
ncbi:glycosyltransferase family 2 protein [Mesobacillus jeotgali]|uniref:glycosyltransferase family 2 protein n=1 Tax=Mesobacillus jeotgali TaxID=129985 RepID=UPI0017839508|nr:glycosyltransferase family 2 protein [Mesobacillus jeotgali]UYZ21794.1 glycosyltransferase [Mesobacillus jeotgali]